MLNGGPVSWTSRRQSVVAQSTLEAEYIALSQACREAAWLRKLVAELGVYKPDHRILIRVDNMGAISTSRYLTTPNNMSEPNTSTSDITTLEKRLQQAE
jgi:hypothetical protein